MSLQTVLSLCQNLHKANATTSSSSTGSASSLLLLVPLHQSLCQAVQLNRQNEYEKETLNLGGPSVPLNEVIDQVFSDPSDASLCRKILLEATPDGNAVGAKAKEQLATFQYLLFQAPFGSMPLKGLAYVVIPWLIDCLGVDRTQQSRDDKDDTSQSIPAASLELLEALLDAVFTVPSKSIDDLQLCLDACNQEIPSTSLQTEWCWTVQGRVLMRLHCWLLEIQSDQAPLVLEVLRDKCTQAMQTSSQSRQSMVAWLRPMTIDWLPYWRDHSPSTGFYSLWECIWKAYHQQQQQTDNKNGSLILLSTTSALCSIIPSIIEEPMPVPQNATDENKAIPFHQACLWDLIHTCLRQGIPRPPSNSRQATDNQAQDKESTMLRRRGLYMLRMIIPVPKVVVADGGKKKKKGQKDPPPKEDPLVLLWKKYIQVMETLEMETEQHLIEQVWVTLTDVMDASAQSTDTDKESQSMTSAPPITWHWTKLLLSRVLTSYEQSMVRKLAIYRFLNGQAGISLNATQKEASESGEVDKPASDNASGSSKKAKGKGKKKANENKKSKAVKKEGAPLTILTPTFVCNIVVVSFDSLVGSVGTNININPDVIDLVPLLSRFISLYYASLEDPAHQREFLTIMWKGSFLEQLHTKTLVPIWECLAQAIASKEGQVEIDSDMLTSLIEAMRHLFNTASVIGAYQESLLGSLATMLRHTKTKQMDPKIILQVISLFDTIILDAKKTTTTMPEATAENKDSPDELDTNPIHASLQHWLRGIGNTSGDETAWISMVSSTVAAAFVRGELLTSPQSSSEVQLWEPLSGANKLEREIGRSVAYLCTLVGRSNLDSAAKAQVTAGELLWPSIHKGLANVPAAMLGTSWTKADVVTRALLLLQEGCRLQVLSGMGNGDLIVDKKTQQMMPPPPNIESLLESASKFILHHISFLVSVDPNKKDLPGASRSGDAKKASVTFANLISQIRLFHEAYPSSMAVSKVVDEMLKTSLGELESAAQDQGADVVQQTALAYAALSCGATLSVSTDVCRLFLHLEFRKIPGKRKSEEQIGRSVFYFAKWGALSCLLPRLLADADEDNGKSKDIDDFLKEFCKIAFEAVQGVPVDAMVAFFRCVIVAGQRQLSTSVDQSGDGGKKESLTAGIIDTLLTIMSENVSSRDAALMLHEFCGLIFQPDLLIEEFQCLKTNAAVAESPIRDAFRRLISLAGTSRPHISRAVLCHITVGWLGPDEWDGDMTVAGIGAISYRQDIMDLLLHKEDKLDVVTTNQSVRRNGSVAGEFELPDGINESSIARGYVLIFFSKLPPPERLHPDVLKLLVHHTILGLLDKICSETTQKGATKLVMIGSDEYVAKIRGWQALCCLSRFVTEDIIGTVCTRVFQAMGEPLHQQIRYFLEVFTVQIARKHPAVVGQALLESINRRDLSLQHIASIMIVAGNLIVGRFKLDFFTQYEDGAKQEAVPLNQILAGTIPWLGSTQGFSRGIAQLLTHKLIPMVVDVKTLKRSTADLVAGEDSNWFLISIYRFLDENQEMKRLRQKSSKFFDSYQVDEICTPSGVLSIPVDEGGDAFPIHLVETMKQCLHEVYEETHKKDLPQWKLLEDMLNNPDQHDASEEDAAEDSGTEDNLANFQRKIIPLDELNLALETLKERRQRNVVGRKKQKLVVCASLVDKATNLGGLARTSEIFAAEKLVIPDIGVAKMDNFKSLSVGAGDWIEIEECREKNLLAYLRAYRARNYFIVGVEQTSSSVSLESFRFPNQPILLLLGKEKEGIPIEFLEAVDQCLEIPQLGIIRSLNVHVSGAVAIWEYTRQRMGIPEP